MEPYRQPELQTCEKRHPISHYFIVKNGPKIQMTTGKLAHIFELAWKKKYPTGNTDIIFFPFAKEGTTKIPTRNIKKQSASYSKQATGLHTKLEKRLQFLDFVQVTSLRPNIVIHLTATKYICNEESQVLYHRPTNYVQRALMANLAFPGRGWLSCFPAQ